VGFGFARHHSQWLAYRWWFRIGGLGLLAICLTLLARLGLYLPVLLAHNGGLSPIFLLIIVGIALTTEARPLLARGIQPWLGEISYGMYILHHPISSHTYSISAWLSKWLWLDPFWFRAAILIVISALFYKFIEVPAREFLRGKKAPIPMMETPEARPL
jgi:peptidoglycan/LPS O-acetylase OafA/YrhL